MLDGITIGDTNGVTKDSYWICGGYKRQLSILGRLI